MSNFQAFSQNLTALLAQIKESDTLKSQTITTRWHTFLAASREPPMYSETTHRPAKRDSTDELPDPVLGQADTISVTSKRLMVSAFRSCAPRAVP